MTLRVLPALVLVIAIFGCPPPATASSSDPLVAVRELGIQIKGAVDRAGMGHAPSGSDLAGFERRIAALSAAQDSDPAFRTKLQSIARLLGNLKFIVAHPAKTAAHAPTRANLDIEQVARHHGDTCANAMGFSNTLPVRLTLGAAGNDSAWFRYEAQTDGHVRFATDSSGTDPALAIFPNCAVGTTAIATNDDALGLDAAVSVATKARMPLWVHLTNSGSTGPIVLTAAAANASISGQIRDATSNQPITSATVTIINAQGGAYITSYLDQNGNFLLSGIPPDSYYVRVYANFHVGELYPSAPCLPGNYYYSTSGCDTTQAQVVTVAAGAAVTGIDFALGAGQQILGQVDDTSNQPIAAATVSLFDSGGNSLLATNTGGNGQYSFATLPAGNYKLEASSGNYVSQMYDHVACDGATQTQCNLANAGVVSVATSDINGVNFNLQALASIQGKVTYDVPPANPIYTLVVVEDSGGNTLAQSYADISGNFTVGPLGVGTYYAYVTSPNYFSQAFAGTDCSSAACTAEMANATAIVISQLGQQPTANFSLHSLPTVSGHIRDATSGLSLANVSVLASANPPLNFMTVGSAATDQNGNYTIAGLPADRYYLWATSVDHVDQIFDGISCESFSNPFSFYPRAACNVASATLLTITPGQTPGKFDFSLTRSSRIAGTARVNAGSASDIPAPNVSINIYDGTGAAVAVAGTDALGNYVVNDLPPGTYYAAVTPVLTYSGQVWRNQNCGSSCNPTTGTAITVPLDASVGDIDFSLIDLGAVVGRVTDSTGSPLAGSMVDLFSTQDGSYQASGIVDNQGYYSARGVFGSSYFVATDAGTAYVDQVYSGISCPLGSAYSGLCPLGQATSLNLGYYSTQPHIVNFVLQRKDEIFANGFE